MTHVVPQHLPTDEAGARIGAQVFAKRSATEAPSPVSVVSVTGTYNATQFIGRIVLLCDASGGNVTVNLPALAGNTAEFHIKKTDSSANTVTVDGSGAETIDGGATAVLLAQYAAIDLLAGSASNWSVL